jgi:hypothetical protein
VVGRGEGNPSSFRRFPRTRRRATPRPQAALPNVKDRSSLETSLNANLHATVMSPGWLNGYGSLLAGGLSPRGVNTDALAARYWADQSPEKRHARELDLLNRALDIQGGVLKEKVPTSVRSAVDTGRDRLPVQELPQGDGPQPDRQGAGHFTIAT